MNKQFTKLIAGLIALLLCGVSVISSTSSIANFSPLNSAVMSSQPNTWYVDSKNAPDPRQNGNWSHPFGNITIAISIANEGDTVNVTQGHYNEAISISKSLNLVGQSRDNTIIDGKQTGAVVTISHALNVSVSGFTILNATRAPHDGISVSGASQVNIFGNRIQKPEVTTGIHADASSSNITMTNNEILGIDNGINAASSNTTITKNTILDCNNGVIVDCTAPNANVSRNVIGDNNITAIFRVSRGLQLLSCNYADVYNNSVTDFDTGIVIDRGGFASIIGNVVKNVSSGFLLLGCYNSTFENNTINGIEPVDIETLGIDFRWIYDSRLPYPLAENNTFSNNTVEGYDFGMKMYFPDRTQTSNMSYNIVKGNTFRYCGYGVYMENISSNYVYHNNFINNKSVNAYDDGNYTNFWNQSYPIGGNYWDDYSGSDTHWGELDKQGVQNRTGRDMMGDTPYLGSAYSGNVKDSYPLNQSWPMSNFWCSEDFKVTAITSCNITNFRFDKNTGIGFNVTTGANGSCTMIIPKSLMDGAFNILVDNVRAVCCFNWSPRYDMISFTYGLGSRNVTITAEFMNRPPMIDFPDIDGDGVVGLPDLTNVATHYGDRAP